MAANIFNGVPHNHQASGLFPSDPTISYFFYYDGTINKVYKHDSTSNTTTIHDIGSGANQLFPGLPTNQAMDRAVFTQNVLFVKWKPPTGSYIQIKYTNSTTASGGQITSPSDVDQQAATSNNSYSVLINSVNTFAVQLPQSGFAIDHLYTTGNWGGTTTPYNGLPQTQHRSMALIPGNNNQVLVFYDTGIVYTIDLSAQTVVSSAPYGATVVNIFNGVPWDHSASVSFDNDPTITYFFRMDPTTNLNKVYIHDETSNTTTVSDIGIPAMFPSVSTIYPIRMGGENLGGPNPDEHLISWLDTTIPAPNLLVTVVTSPTAVVVQPFTQNDSLIYHEGQSIEQASTGNKWYAHFSYDRWLALRGSISHFLSTGSYGAPGQPYAGLPYIAGGVGVETNYCSLLRVNGQENQMYLFTPTGDAIIMDLLAQQISSTVPYGPIAPTPPPNPPTPLPDIVVTYYSPQDYGYFASNTALVSETQYGFNFTKTGLANADKMELYLYFATAPGAIPFNYNDLRDIRVLMKNNLVLQPGEIFFNIYTVGTAGGWYGTRTTYLGTPPLGTTFDPALVETIIPLSDSRTDQILAISLGSNSAGQQFNFDVEKASFEILLPSTNETQRVEIKLQNSFIALDDEYWNFDNIAQGYSGSSLTASTGWDITAIDPNIVAGNFPQSATFQSPTGTAWYLNGTFTNWTTTDNITWTDTGDTMTFQNVGSSPGIASNGAAYIGCAGSCTSTGNWLPTNPPINWEITSNNKLSIQYVGGGQTNYYSLLSGLGTPNNFTAAQKEKGCYASTQSTGVNVLIGSITPVAKSLIFPATADITVLNNTQLIIRRNWELTNTTYTLDPSDPTSVTGQYVDPAFSTALTPTSYKMPTNWVVLANDAFQFEILFSAGLNNSLPAESQNFRQMTVTPTPSLASLSFTWTANYYTAGNILIGPVAGIQTTGLVSGFTTGGSLKPANAAYILYGCTSNQNVDAFASLVFIEPDPAAEFDLLFNRGLINTMFSDGPYTVNVSPVATGVTYTFTGKYYDVNNGFLGDVIFTPQPDFFTYTFSFATFPSAKYISFVGTSSEGVTAQLSIAICEPQPGPGPPPVITSVTTEEAIISKINFHVNDSHKIIDDAIISELRFTLTDSDGRVKYTNDNIYYEIEVKEIDANP